jgi:predicted Zn-dependent protease
MARPRPLAPLFLPLLVAGLFLPACITDPVTGESVLGMPMSDTEEVSMGNQYAPSFRSQYEGAYPDPELQGYLGGIVGRITRASHRPDLPWNFTVLNSSEVNAFALPGGNICITRGLLGRLENESQFAAVMAHEAGHVAHKHAAQSQGQAALVGLVVGAVAVGASLADSEVATLGATLGAVGAQLLLLKYSRDHEEQADQRGVEYALKAGYDPREMAGIFEIFKSLKEGGSTPEWLSTHPDDDSRIAAVAEEIGTKYPQVRSTPGLVRDTPRFAALNARLREAQKVYDVYDEASADFAAAIKAGDPSRFPSVLARLSDCASRLPGHALFVSGAGVVLHQQGRIGEARQTFERAAAMQPDLFEPQAFLARIAFAQGDAASAFRHAESARELFPHHPAGHYFAGRVFDARGQTGEAATAYRSVIELAPEESEEYAFAAQRLKDLEAGAAPGASSTPW